MSDFAVTMENLSKLIEDAVSCDAHVSSMIAFKSTPVEGIGVFANTDIPVGETLMRIPYSLCLSVDMIMCDESLCRVIDDNPSLLEYPDEILAMAIAYAATKPNCGCEWSQHVSTFPSTLNTTLFWSDEELLELRYCNAYHLTRLLKNQIRNDWETLHQPLSHNYPEILGDNSLETYAWALSIVYSRAIGITRNGKYVRCIPPILDMANHSPEAGDEAASTFHYDESSNEVRFINTIVKSQGAECFAVYGKYPNAKLAFTYGFVHLGNPHRAIDVWTKVTPVVSNSHEKSTLLAAHTLTANQEYNFVGTLRDGYISPALLATVRVIQATDEELRSEAIENAFLGEIVSARNELATYFALREMLIAKIRVDEAEADREKLGALLLSAESLSNRLLIALIVRVEERELMQDCVSLVDSYMSDLNVLIGAGSGENYIPPDSMNSENLSVQRSRLIELKGVEGRRLHEEVK